MQYFYFYSSQLKNLAVFSNNAFKLWFCSRAIHDGGTGFFTQVHMSAYEICMKMGFKDVFQFHTVFFKAVSIRLGFP